jgi:hypothetical protein
MGECTYAKTTFHHFRVPRIDRLQQVEGVRHFPVGGAEPDSLRPLGSNCCRGPRPLDRGKTRSIETRCGRVRTSTMADFYRKTFIDDSGSYISIWADSPNEDRVQSNSPGVIRRIRRLSFSRMVADSWNCPDRLFAVPRYKRRTLLANHGFPSEIRTARQRAVTNKLEKTGHGSRF